MGRLITCTEPSIEPLTRGQQYELLAQVSHDGAVQWVKVLTDDGRRRWLTADHFDLTGAPVTLLAAWRFDEPVVDELNGRSETDNWVDVGLKFTDGSRRWCQLITPDFLKGYLEQNTAEPMFCARNLIVVRDPAEATVEKVLYTLDQSGDLFTFSLPLDGEETDEEQ